MAGSSTTCGEEGQGFREEGTQARHAGAEDANADFDNAPGEGTNEGDCGWCIRMILGQV